ncbi:MAG: hypothetical protein O2812_03975 [Chloroflexi bacterium]|nr:hypothetical protein [Chloroflexota bacterium]
MTTEEIIITIVRVAGALLVLRWALAGGLVAIAVDLSDLFLMNLLDQGGVRDYQSLYKWLDLAYMATFLVVALRWSGLTRQVAVLLFGYRIIGVVVFEIVGERWKLLGFPNVFEFWFLFVAAAQHFRPGYQFTTRRSMAWLVVLLAAKEVQEYALHGARWLDQYVAVDLVADWWRWLARWF